MGNVGVNVVVIHAQLVELCCSAVGFIGVSPGLNKFIFKIVIDGACGSRRCRNGYNPVLYALLPLIDVGSGQVDEGMCDFAPEVLYDGV